jgi:hypothetical protein
MVLACVTVTGSSHVRLGFDLRLELRSVTSGAFPKSAALHRTGDVRLNTGCNRQERGSHPGGDTPSNRRIPATFEQHQELACYAFLIVVRLHEKSHNLNRLRRTLRNFRSVRFDRAGGTLTRHSLRSPHSLQTGAGRRRPGSALFSAPCERSILHR